MSTSTRADLEELTREELIQKVLDLERGFADFTSLLHQKEHPAETPSSCAEKEEAQHGYKHEEKQQRCSLAADDVVAQQLAEEEEEAVGAGEGEGEPFHRREEEVFDSAEEDLHPRSEDETTMVTEDARSTPVECDAGNDAEFDAVKSRLEPLDLEADIRTMRTPTPSRSAVRIQDSLRGDQIQLIPGSTGCMITTSPGNSSPLATTPVAQEAKPALKPALRIAQLNSPAGIASPLLQESNAASTPPVVYPSPAPPCRRQSGAALGSAHKLKNLFEQRCQEVSEKKPSIDGSVGKRVPRRTAPAAPWQVDSGTQSRAPKPKISLQDLIRAEEAMVAEAQGPSTHAADLFGPPVAPLRSGTSQPTSIAAAARHLPAAKVSEAASGVPPLHGGRSSWQQMATTSTHVTHVHPIGNKTDRTPAPKKKTLQELLQQDEELRNMM